MVGAEKLWFELPAVAGKPGVRCGWYLALSVLGCVRGKCAGKDGACAAADTFQHCAGGVGLACGTVLVLDDRAGRGVLMQPHDV